ncbi:MAG: FemAB family PEP-CTERM system-associated protein [Pirellulaceae bacterium]|nr:FemAB family PEP-CTERM system-associated protein [Pirellulaceae bacterium]
MSADVLFKYTSHDDQRESAAVVTVRLLQSATEDLHRWDRYVLAHPEATMFHLSSWQMVIQRALGYQPSYLLAEQSGAVVGICPLFVLRTRLFGTFAVSLPFLNYGGIVGDSIQIQQALLDQASDIGRQADCRYIELRQRYPLQLDLPRDERKVGSFLSLEGGTEQVFKRLHQNVRNKVRKAEKNEVIVQSGPECLKDFYAVYSRNLRDLGTPVISPRFFAEIQRAFPDTCRVYRAVRHGHTIAAKFVVFDANTCYFVWSASIRDQLQYAPVQLMNWRAIEDAIGVGCQTVDFGRSTRGSSHEEFKKFWGVQAETLPWCYKLLSQTEMPGLAKENPKFSLAIEGWKRLPLPISRLLGPPLARLLP